MREIIARYARWLHTGNPSGRVERLPDAGPDGTTRLPGVFVVGDLTGVPLLKFATDTGARVVERIEARAPAGALDTVILGGGVAGMAAALEAKRRGLRFVVLEAAEPFSTIRNFPLRKPIFTYPRAMHPHGRLQVSATVREDLIDELREQVEGERLPVVLGVSARAVRRAGEAWEVELEAGAEPRPWQGAKLPDGWSTPLRARTVIVALGRSGNYRTLDVPGEELDHVSNRLHDPAKFAGRKVLVVGGGDSAAEAVVALAEAGADVALSYRGRDLIRPKPENIDAVARSGATTYPESGVREIRAGEVELDTPDGPRTLAADAVLVLIGREPPLAFFRRSGIPVVGEFTPRGRTAFGAFLTFCVLLYLWKGGLIASGLDAIGWRDPSSLVGATVNAAKDPGFYYTLAYCACVVGFGIRRIRRRRTPYVRLQTVTLMAIQVVPLFLLPQIVLPWMGANGWIPDWIRAQFFPGDSWWRAYGLILAWPLFFWNLASSQPIAGWLVLSAIQTLVIIPLLIRRWGKGAYCGWICSCGALAETMGDAHRGKMWHGPAANRWNMAGQVVLALALVGLGWRVLGWALPDGNAAARGFEAAFGPLYKWSVDLFLAGAIGVGFYFWYSGRVWCRFFCPLAALMHVYTKFTRYRILAEKDKCISCNVCTSVCHQGIDVMNFANQGRPMSDVECVRCSACVQECPTGTLSFGRVDARGVPTALDRVAASPVHVREGEQREAILTRLRAQAGTKPAGETR